MPRLVFGQTGTDRQIFGLTGIAFTIICKNSKSWAQEKIDFSLERLAVDWSRKFYKLFAQANGQFKSDDSSFEI